ncbi:MAG: NUDIX domain-containing protein [Chloroflexi bacterium]|nr:NUDIX domain-containing protein [Chloroflexota bacterium]
MSVERRDRPTDTTWRPHPGIRVIAIGVVREGSRLLCLEGWDPSEPEPFYRPIGGGVHPSERGRDALEREFREELGAEIASAALVGVLENLFTFNGEPGHEVVLVFDVELADPSLLGVESLNGIESNGQPYVTRWIEVEDARRQDVTLYPEGLLELLEGSRR